MGQNSKTFLRAKVTASGDLSFLSSPEFDGDLGRLNGYRVLQVIGKGGMGLVLRAEDTRLHREVALKVIKPEIASDEVMKERFLREARSAAAISHDNIVTVHQVGEENEVLFLAMQLLAGETLQSRLQRSTTLSLDESIRIIHETTQALRAAHTQGLTHRDIKPENIWLEKDSGRVKVLDFGLARLIDDNHKLTRSGVIIGTPQYLSPEQAEGGVVDPRSDLFSLGVVFYQMLTGESPFARTTLLATLGAIGNYSPEPPSRLNQEVPNEISNFVMTLLQRNPAQRPQFAEEVVSRLNDLSVTATNGNCEVTVASPPKPSSCRNRNGLKWAGLAGLILFVTWGIALQFRTPQGTLFVEVGDGVSVSSLGETLKIRDMKSSREFHLQVGDNRLPTGEYELVITDDGGLSFSTKEFRIVEAETERLVASAQIVTVAENKVQFDGPIDSQVCGASMSPDGQSLVTALKRGALHLWAKSQGDSFRYQQELAVHNPCSSLTMAWSADGKLFAFVDGTKAVILESNS